MAEAGERPASVKMNLDLTEYLVSLKRMQQENKRTGEEGEKKLKLIGKGIDAAKRSMGELGGSLKQGLKQIASFGGAFSIGAGIKGAAVLDAKYRQIAFRASQVNDTLITQAEIQKIVERAASKSSRTDEELVDVFNDLREATGDLDFSADVIEQIGLAATASGEDLGVLTNLADQLHTKFGIASEGIQDAFAQVLEASQKGGPSFQQFSEVASSVGAELLAAGLKGKEGLDFMLGALVATDDQFKSLPAQVKGLKQLLRGLGDKGELKNIAKGLGISAESLINEKDFTARLNKILGHGASGVKALLGSMNEGEEKQATKILFTDPFEQALKQAHASGLKGKAAIDEALKVLDDGIRQMGKAHKTGADLEKQAQEEMKSPQAQLRMALNNLNRSFERPEIIHALNELSKLLPVFAGYLGDLVAFAAKHPVAAAAGFVGAKVGGAAASAMLGDMASKIIGAHVKGGQAAASTLLERLRGGMPGITGQAGGAMGLAFKAASVAAAGAIGYEIGSAIAPFIIDPLVDKGLKEARDVEGGTESAIANAAGGGSAAVLRDRLAKLEAALETERKAKLGTGFMDQGIAAFGGPDVEQMSKDRLGRGEAAATDLRHRIREQLATGDRRSGTGATVAMEPDVIKGKVALAAGAPREIAGALVTGLSGKVLTVRVVNGGEGVSARSVGTRGPRPMAAPAPSGGV